MEEVMESSIIWIIAISTLIAGIALLVRHNSHKNKIIDVLLDQEFPQITKNDSILRSVDKEIEVYLASEMMKANAQQSARKKLAIPEYEPIGDSGSETVTHMIDHFNGLRMTLSGGEQLFLDIFPPAQVAECIINSIHLISIESLSLSKDAVSVLHEISRNGIANIHNPEAVSQCVKCYFEGLGAAVLKEPIILEKICKGLERHNYTEIVKLVTNPHAVFDGVDQIFHLTDASHTLQHVSVDHIHHAATGIADHINGITPDVSAHIPYVTIFFSGVREINLLSNNKTNIENAIANVLIDAASRFAGAAIGGTTGATLGGIFGGPVGFIVGKIFGGIIGGVIGGEAGNSIKEIDLKNAKEIYENHFDAMLIETKQKALEISTRILNAQRGAKLAIDSELDKAPSIDPDQLAIKEINENLIKSLKEDISRLDETINKIRSNPNLQSNYAKDQIDYRTKKYIPLREATKAMDADQVATILRLSDLNYLVGMSYENKVANISATLSEINAKYSAALLIWERNLIHKYQLIIAEMSKSFNDDLGSYCLLQDKWSGVIKDDEKQIKREMEILGKA